MTLSGKLEIIKSKMLEHRKMLEEHDGVSINGSKKIIEEFDNYCKKIDRILKDYKIISELAHIAGDDREGIERRLVQRYS